MKLNALVVGLSQGVNYILLGDFLLELKVPFVSILPVKLSFKEKSILTIISIQIVDGGYIVVIFTDSWKPE